MNKNQMVRLVALVVSFSLFLTISPLSTLAKDSTYKEVAEGTHGMVSTSHPLASKVGTDILKKGGNAIDASIAIQFALNVVEPMMSGIGGGGFMMVFDAETEEITIIDSRERAPAGATPDMFLDENGRVIPFSVRSRSGKAVGVPGTLRGLETALETWGTRPLQELITPAVKLAEKGFEVDRQLALAIEAHQEKLSATAAKDVFLPNGTPLKEGDWLKQEDLAKTLKLIHAHGSDVFYNGRIGDAIVEIVQQCEGSMTIEDLRNYNITIDKPIYGEYKNYQIASMPPPSSGGLFFLQMLKIVEGFDIGQYDIRSVDKYHLLSETMRLSYADRAAYAGDPEFVDVPMNGLLHPEYIKERQSLLSLNEVNPHVEAGDPWKYEDRKQTKDVVEQDADKEIGETTHFTVADRWGNVVSFTTTIEQLFGTGIMVPGYGIILNNELTDFDARPGGANEVQPNKRPLSSMTPTIILKDNKPVLTLGSPGGTTIISSVFQTFINVFEYEMELKEAIEEPRIYNDHTSATRWEKGIPDEVRGQLVNMGHRYETSPQSIGNVQSIFIDYENGIFYGAADSRREGAAIGISNPDRWMESGFHYTFEGKDGDSWDQSKFLVETDTDVTFDLLHDGIGRIALGGRPYASGRASSYMEWTTNSELLVPFRIDQLGPSRYLRFWLRADDWVRRSSPYNGYGIEIRSGYNNIRLIRTVNGNEIEEIGRFSRLRSTDWQWLRFKVENNQLSVKVWDDEETEPSNWDLEIEDHILSKPGRLLISSIEFRDSEGGNFEIGPIKVEN
jgi:gamma-glutamyltranspeptidase/glutathione hydrolase